MDDALTHEIQLMLGHREIDADLAFLTECYSPRRCGRYLHARLREVPVTQHAFEVI